ncbi:hypothetical protein [Actinomycetospora atypica]|uniref:Uncharacterized protein n=1 Tax=Actinomycetospora atypica TaxID=1290095 RepID=A0ABV9YKS8_9PSEU
MLLEDDQIDEACDRYAAADKTQWGFDDASWRLLARELRDRQEQIARRGRTISYSELVAGTAVADLDHWYRVVGDLLLVVADAAHEARLPMLTAVATKKAGDRPGGGFYDAARHFGALSPGTGDDEGFWIKQLKDVYAHWHKTRSA